jgi:hypothetical protein
MCVAHLAGIKRLHDKIIETIFYGSTTARATMVRHAQGCPACWRELGAAIDGFLAGLPSDMRPIVAEVIKVKLEVAEQLEQRWERLSRRNLRHPFSWKPQTDDSLPN